MSADSQAVIVWTFLLGEAQESFHKAVVTLIDSFASDDAFLRDYLDKKGVQHRFIKESPTSEERYFERRLEVGLGATA